MHHWLTTILILVPVAGALLVAIAPLPGYWLGSVASLVSLLEVGFWITATAKFDFSSPALQLGQNRSWFSDLGVSYHVGQYAFSLWLVGATVVVMAACVIYGWWVGRDRARAYFSLMLLLTGAIVGVFTAQDGCARRSRSSSTRSSARCSCWPRSSSSACSRARST